MPLLGGKPGLIASSFDQVIRKDPASRGTETSAEVLVGPPGDDAGGWNRTLVHSKHGAGTGKKELHWVPPPSQLGRRGRDIPE